MIKATNLGFPRIGANRELKRALESFWRGESSEQDLLAVGRSLRRSHWELQRDLGLDHIPSNDFSYYDHVLDAAVMVGAVPDRFEKGDGAFDLDTYFTLARGLQEKSGAGSDGQPAGVQAMEMTKWFDTNYHYIVPELRPHQSFHLGRNQAVDAFEEARAVGIHTRPVLLGPVSFLLLSKVREGSAAPLDLLDGVLPVYAEVLATLEAAGADWIQVDEPFLALDLDDRTRSAFVRAYDRLAGSSGLKLLLATYFEGLRGNTSFAFGLPVDAVHLDLVRSPDGLAAALERIPPSMSLSLGVVDGRNVWRADLDRVTAAVEEAARQLSSDRVMIGPSCSLLHVPVDVGTEPDLDDETASWLAFAKQKVEEIVAVARRASGEPADERLFERSRRARKSRRASGRIHDDRVQSRLQSVDDPMLHRRSSYAVRRRVQRRTMELPPLPTTTIGSFPQTAEVRRARSQLRDGTIDEAEYDEIIAAEIRRTIRMQEDAGLDILVHGEPERSDMVEYFAQKLAGFLITRNGWVQSYGSRCVRPPIIFGDVSRPEPMTVRWTTHAQTLTDHPVKGMVTGPVTLLQWSFVRDDQIREATCRQIALAVRDEVKDLEAAGVKIIQIDEPGLREGLPLRRADQKSYLDWAIRCFRLATSGVEDATQIHTHMCYAEFNDIIDAIADMDADVISIESSRSQMELLDVFESTSYPNEIGPGIYDIHSPRIPGEHEMRELIERALKRVASDRMWVNPDCGLKTRRWAEVEPALRNMVAAARSVRERLTSSS